MIKGTTLYKVKISNASGSTPETKGFFDNLKCNQYDDFKTDADEGLVETYKIKARGHCRFCQMAIDLQKGLDYMGQIVTEGATSTESPTSMEFVLGYTQPDGLFVEVSQEDFDSEKDETMKIKTRDGKLLFIKDRAIIRIVANVLSSNYKPIANYFNSEPLISKKAYGWELKELTVDAPCKTIEEAESLVKVEKIF